MAVVQHFNLVLLSEAKKQAGEDLTLLVGSKFIHSLVSVLKLVSSGLAGGKECDGESERAWH